MAGFISKRFMVYVIVILCLLCALTYVSCQNNKAYSKYTTCRDCVGAGFGWSVDQEKCGGFANKDCSTEADMQTDDDDDDDDNDDDNDNDDNDNEDNDGDDDDNGDEDNSDNESNDESNEDDDADIMDSSPRTYAWADTEITTHLWQLISRGNVDGLQMLIDRDPNVIHERSADGRGPLFWAYEYDQPHIVELLLQAGADENAKDRNGDSPRDLVGKAPK